MNSEQPITKVQTGVLLECNDIATRVFLEFLDDQRVVNRSNNSFIVSRVGDKDLLVDPSIVSIEDIQTQLEIRERRFVSEE